MSPDIGWPNSNRNIMITLAILAAYYMLISTFMKCSHVLFMFIVRSSVLLSAFVMVTTLTSDLWILDMPIEHPYNWSVPVSLPS
jgi:hypothetical protein